MIVKFIVYLDNIKRKISVCMQFNNYFNIEGGKLRTSLGA